MEIIYSKKSRGMTRKTLWVLLCIFAGITGAYSQQKVSGTVIDESQLPVPGVSIILKNAQGSIVSGMTTDGSGKYEISVPSENSTLEFSYIGYASQSVQTASRSVIDIALAADTKVIDDVVIVGYGVQKRAHLTGAVSQVTSTELTKAPMQNVSNMLTGKISGLTSIQSSGMPGADGAALYVRGLNSFSNNGPYVIVDGVHRTMDNVNPNDVESISVLKDAAAAIYGIQGANGVILVTTKSGSSGPAKISYDGSVTFTQNTAMPKLLNATDYMYWHNKASAMDLLTPVWTAEIQNKVLSNDPNTPYGETDWLNKIFRLGVSNQHNVSATGGTERMKYYTSMGYMNQQGTLKNTDLQRYNVRANLDVLVAKNLRFTVGIAADRVVRNYPGTAIGNQQEFNPVRQAISAVPILKSDFEGLPVAWQNGSYSVSGYAALHDSGYKVNTQNVLNSNYKLEYDLSGLTDVLKGLKVSLFAAYNYSHTNNSNYDRYYEVYAVSPGDEMGRVVGASGYTPGNAYTKSSSWGDKWLLRPQIEYSREFGKHFVGATFLYEAQRNYSNTMTGTKKGYHSDDPVDISLGAEFADTPVTGSHKYSGGNASYIGRVNYAYDSKYLFEATFRRDGSYVFAPENRWGSFPMVSVGWVMSKENFFEKALPFVNYLKIRGAWGSMGNENNATPFLYNSTYNLATNSMVLGNQPVAQFYSTNAYIYRDLKWSTTYSYNVGLDADMWNGKLGIEFDWFYKITSDIMEEQSGSYPSSLGGYFPSKQNSGKVENKGFEITLKHYNRINKDWSYSIRGNVSFARNKVLSKVTSDNHPNYRPVLGASMGAQYGFQALGLFQSQEEIDNYPNAPSGNLRPGDIKYLDVNGDGKISSEYDYVKIGYGSIPEINFSLNVDVNYKNFYLNMLWQGVTHVSYELSGVYNTGVTASTVYTSSFAEGGNSPYYRIEDAWTPENTGAKYPRLTTKNSGNNAWRSTWWLVNGEYLRLKQASIGYTFTNHMLRRTPFNQINIYVAGTNLLTLSHFKYVDPESPSVSNGYYPQPRTFSMGVKITF